MNQKQRIVLFVMSGIIILIFLFPPYVIRVGQSGKHIGESGYGCIFALPRSERWRIAPTVNVSFMLAQIFGVLVVGGIIWFALKDKE